MTAVIAGLAVLVAIGTAYVSTRQLRESRRANSFPPTVDLFREYRQPEMVKARKRIFDEMPEQDSEGGIQGLPKDLRYSAEKVMHYLDNLGVLVANDLMKPEIAAGFLGASAVSVWWTTKDFIVRERELRQEPRYQEYFEHLVATVVLPETQAALPEVRKWEGGWSRLA